MLAAYHAHRLPENTVYDKALRMGKKLDFCKNSQETEMKGRALAVPSSISSPMAKLIGKSREGREEG